MHNTYVLTGPCTTCDCGQFCMRIRHSYVVWLRVKCSGAGMYMRECSDATSIFQTDKLIVQYEQQSQSLLPDRPQLKCKVIFSKLRFQMIVANHFLNAPERRQLPPSPDPRTPHALLSCCLRLFAPTGAGKSDININPTYVSCRAPSVPPRSLVMYMLKWSATAE